MATDVVIGNGMVGRLRTCRFDKFAGSEFERAKRGPQGAGQEARSNPAGRHIPKPNLSGFDERLSWSPVSSTANKQIFILNARH